MMHRYDQVGRASDDQSRHPDFIQERSPIKPKDVFRISQQYRQAGVLERFFVPLNHFRGEGLAAESLGIKEISEGRRGQKLE